MYYKYPGHGGNMKKIISLITLVLMTQSALAEDIQTQPAADATGNSAAELIESDAAATSAAKALNEQSGFSRGSVVRSAFTTEILEREPTENLKKLSNSNSKVMFFTELRDMKGQTAVHRWEHDGKIVAEVEFNVKGPRWRVWSSKNLTPEATGDWKVSVLNAAGDIISEQNLDYEVAAATPTTSSTESTPASNEPAASTEMQ